MRWMRFFMFLIVLLPSQVSAQQHSEAVCLLFQQQIDRYANQKSNPNYRSARREYDKYCYAQAVKKPQPTAAAPKVTPVPASPVETKTIEPVISADAASNTNIALEPADTGATQSEKAENAGIASKDTSNQTDLVPELPVETAAPAAGATDVAETNLPAANTNAAAPRQVVVRDAGSDFDALLLEILLATPLVAANIVAFLLVVLKLWALGATGALSVAASLADSAMDLMVSLGAMAAIFYAAKPADEDHAFGHTSAEDLAALAH